MGSRTVERLRRLPSTEGWTTEIRPESTSAPMPGRVAGPTVLLMSTMRSTHQEPATDGVRERAVQMSRMLVRALRWGLHPSLLLNTAAPLAAYSLLTRHGLTTLQALIAAAVFPAFGIVLTAARARRVDLIGGLSLATIALGILGGLVFQDSRFLLVKDSMVTGVLGLACLVSLLLPRPLIFVLGRQFNAGHDRTRLDLYDRLWRSEEFRARSRRTTFIWGVALMAEASTRVALSFVIAPGALLAISPLLAVAVFGPLAIWTMRRLRTRGLLTVQRAA
jgi:hypothetical protein